MDIIISNSSGVPIYEQIEEQIKSQIISGELVEGDALPSMRVLAKELKISIITTKRAYEELEQEGFLYKIAGKGCYVAKRNEALVRENYLREIEEKMDQIQKLASSAGLNKEEVLEMWNTMWEDEA